MQIYMFYGTNVFNNGGSPNINNWNTSNVTNMSNMFFNADDFNQNIGAWDVSNVTNMAGMFESANLFNNGGSPDINNWSPTSATTMLEMFRSANSFNQPIGGWNVSSVGNMSLMFYQNTSFDQDLSLWNVSNVTNMNGMFGAGSVFNNGGSAGINNWNTLSVTDMAAMFYSNISFNQPIGNWNTSNVTSMYQMFLQAVLFNQDISAWDTSGVTTIQSMFSDATAFNNGGQPLPWNTASVTNMAGAFYASAFNQDISSWNTSSVTRMDAMFYNNTVFNQDISGWNVSNVSLMNNMFRNSTAFNYPLGDWNISNVTNFIDFMTGKTAADYSAANLDDIYSKWSLLTVSPNESISFGTIKYTISGQAGRNILTGAPNNWSIIDGGAVPQIPLIFTVENTFNANPLSVTIPTDTATYAYNYNVSTSDGQSFSNQTGNLTINFAGVGPYDITVSGIYPSMRFGTNPGTANKIVDVKQFGNNVWQDFRDMFAYSLLSVVTATDTPDLSAVTSLKSCFKNATSYNDSKLNDWDVSTITTFETFLWCAGPVIYGSFNQDLSSWNVSNANTFYYMFDGCPMNQSFAAWNVTALGTTNPTTAGLEFISPDTSQTPKMSTANYDATLISWAGQAVQSGVTINFRAAQYTLGGAAEAARNTLINTYGWSIVDGGGI